MCKNGENKKKAGEKKERRKRNNDKTPVEISTWWNGKPMRFIDIMGL